MLACRYFGRALDQSTDAVAKTDKEMVELEQAIQETTANLANIRNSLNDVADSMADKFSAIAAEEERKR